MINMLRLLFQDFNKFFRISKKQLFFQDFSDPFRFSRTFQDFPGTGYPVSSRIEVT